MSDVTKRTDAVDAVMDKAVARYEARAVRQAPEANDKSTQRDIQELEERVLRLENQLQAALDSLNAATIECAGSSVTLTLPDFPT